MSRYTMTANVRQNLVAIYNWIQENKPNLKNGVTNSIMFAHVVRNSRTNEYYPKGMKNGDPLYTSWCNVIATYKRKGYMFYKKDLPNKPPVWSVNEAYLPAGTVTYTGVQTTIPFTPEPEKPQPTEPTEPTEPTSAQTQAFIEEELKGIVLDQATIRRKGIALALTEPTLYQLYKLGLTLNEVTEPAPNEPEENYEQARSEQQEQELQSLPEAASEPEDPAPFATSAPF